MNPNLKLMLGAMLAILLAATMLATAASASSFIPNPHKEEENYKGPFTTQVLYTMCSSKDSVSREKCEIYLQGLMYGLKMQTYMKNMIGADGKDMTVCLPETTVEAARLNMLHFIDSVTGGNPGSNGDSGNWIAYISLGTGHLCNK